MTGPARAGLAAILIVAAACSDAPLEPVRSAPPAGWSGVKAFAYQLQDIDIAAIARAPIDLVVIDYSRDGSDETAFTADDIAVLQNTERPKRVLAYMSIGEAETYRWYWRRAWDRDRDGKPDRGAPAWLGPSNPDWPGNYKVRYWDPAWQRIVFGSPTAYVDRVMEAGFDGVYLDIIDAFEYWRPRGRRTAAREMADLVIALATYARARYPSFGVFPQNGETLARFDDYVSAVDGIGREDLFTVGNRPQPRSETRYALGYLRRFARAGKIVLVIDYPRRPALGRAFTERARELGFIPYVAVRALDRLVTQPASTP